MRSQESGGGVRYAPSPSGRLHLGNLRTAWVAKHLAERLAVPFVVRVEDIDTPRVLAGAQALQLEDMAAVGAKADTLEVQSAFAERHRELFDAAVSTGAIYPCICSRSQVKAAIANLASAPHASVPVYDGKCRTATSVGPDTQVGWRWRAEDPSGVEDILIARTMGPRDDFQPAYHWACAIDDWDGKFSWIVRAWDLASARAPQRAIQLWLASQEKSEVALPRVFHTTTIVDAAGKRLEKRSQGVTLPELITAGWTVPQIVAKFLASFETALPAEGDGGEALPELRVPLLLG